MGVLDEQPMPDSLAMRCGGRLSSKQARMMAELMEIVPAAGAEGGDRALIVAVRESQLILRQAGMMQLRLSDVGHCAASGKETTPNEAA